MARSVPWRRVISDAASWHQDQALNSTIYILRQTGPTGFLLKEEGEAKKFKVFLGDPHKCTCPVFAKEKDLCKHIMWVLLKKFRVPRQNPITWQFGLVEREINEILRGVLAHQEARQTQAARKYANIAAHMGRDPNSKQAVIPQREISEDDVCPICQDELLAKHLPVTYCKFGCGNNVHIKCMKVWADHQKSSGKTIIECPFCREDFGPISLLEQEMKNSTQRETRAERMNEHLGTTCRNCHICPIKGKCYKCSVCNDYHLCQACFNTPVHMEHNFLFRQKASQRWRPAANRSQGGLLPDAVVTNLMTREISEQDYDLLLQLDNQAAQQLSDLTEETVQSFPMERIRQNGPLLAPGQQCRICLQGYEVGQFVRRLPCHHKFHRDCIDNWLLHRHPTCPIDGTTYTNESVRQMKAANRERLRQLQLNASSETENTSNKTTRGRNAMVTNGNLDLEIPGIGIARILSLNNNPTHRTVTNQNNHSDERHSESLVTPNGQPDGVVQDHVRNVGTLNTRRTQSSCSLNSAANGTSVNGTSVNLTAANGTSVNPTGVNGTAISNASRYPELSGLTVGEVVGVNIRQPSVNSVDENIINVIASTNRRYHLDDDDDDDDDDDEEYRISDDVLQHVLNDSRIGSAQSEHRTSGSFRSSAASGHQQSLLAPNLLDGFGSAGEVSSTLEVKGSQQVLSGDRVFDPSHQDSAKDSLLQEVGQDHLNNRQNRTVWRQTTSYRNNGIGRELDQVVTITNRQHVSNVSNRVHNADQQEQSSHVASIPLPRNDNDLLLGIGNISRKPPSGESLHRQGRLRSRVTHRDTTRTNSRGRERSGSQERRDQVNNFDSLYIGHSPSSRVGFNSGFLLSATESKSSKSLLRTRTKQELKSNQPATRRTTPESDTQTINDLSLAGSRLSSSHQQHTV